MVELRRPRGIVLAAVLLAAGCVSEASSTSTSGTKARTPATVAVPEPGEEPAPEAEPESEAPVPDGPGWLGVELAAREPNEAGVAIRDVTPDSPAERAGLAAGDVLLSIDGEAVSRPNDVVRLIAQRRAGARVALAFRRGDADRLAKAVLGARPDMDELMRKTYIGSPAPSLTALSAVQGSVPLSVGALRGKVVVVEFWASWCVPCRMTAPKLNAWHDRWRAEGLEVLGVTTDPAVFASQAAVEFGIRYAVASDESGKTSRAWRALSIPTLFVIDRSGVVREVVVGYSSDRLAEAERLVEKLVRTP
ncbi:MAG TPA: redoxin domain-containing protein [Polyangiaceae bacterium]|nr:redoxin domain-containing protein [Polyangiaceae bacterium]